MKSFTPDSSVVSDVIPSPNFGERAKGRAPDMILLHYTGMPDVEGALTRLCKAGTEVSAHYVVLEDGRILQCVPESKRAWHAGVSEWAGRTRCNDFSIGVELEGTDELAYTAPQYRELARLTSEILDRYPIADIVGHSHIAPGRKTDPGPVFDWAGYRLLLQNRRRHGDLPAFPGIPASK